MSSYKNNSFYLMNKDTIVLEFCAPASPLGKIELVSDLESVPGSILPYGFSNIQDWLAERKAPAGRANMEQLFKQCGCRSLGGFIRVSRALSLNDSFWVKPTNFKLDWNSLSLYKNEFNSVITRLAFEGGPFDGHFSEVSPEFVTDGSYAKCWKRIENEIFLLKAGSSDARNAGLEPYSECLASQVGSAFLGSSVNYSLTNFRNEDAGGQKAATLCKLFTSENIGFAQVVKMLDTKTPLPGDLFEFYKNIGSEDAFRKMIVFDALCLNQDRHLGNHGVLFDNDSLEIIGMAPVFDNNLSFIPFAIQEQLDDLQNYMGTLRPRIGDDFNAIAHEMLTPSIERELRNLFGFKFDRTLLGDFPEDRLEKMEFIVNYQIDNILQNRVLYVETAFDSEHVFDDQLEGWDDEIILDKIDSVRCMAKNANICFQDQEPIGEEKHKDIER